MSDNAVAPASADEVLAELTAPESMFDHIYVEETPLVAAERREFVEYHAGFEGGH